ncbi:MAG: TonB-dependent receptor plug domain-containing protein [Paludibacteraceae bacterium]|nr:TonB-dependent receptor plug domain-containing protein [Paludibacteraceae bacterium]
MKRLISILICALCSVLCLPLHAQDTMRVEDFRLDEVEVLGTFVIIDDFSGPQNKVKYFTHDEIQHLPISNISDVLNCLSGLDVRSRGTTNAQTDISLYGGTFDQVLVMLNGIPVNDAQTGHYAMNIPITPALIQRIEVRQGNAALSAGAFTGLVNIITRQTWEDQYTLQMDAGTNASVHPLMVGSWARRDVHVNVSAEYARSNGYYAPTEEDKEREALRNTDYQLANLYLQTRWRNLDAQIGAQYKDAGLGTGYGFASTDQFDATRTLFASIQNRWDFGSFWSLSAQASYRTNYDRYEWHRGAVTNRHWTHSTRAALEAEYFHPEIGTTTLRAEIQDDYIRSTNMGEHNRIHATLSAKHLYEHHGWIAALGAAGHYNTWFGWNGTGYAYVGYTSLFITASRSVRMPTWTDLYYKAGVQRGNTDLKAEKAWTLALNGQYTWDWRQAGQLHIAGNIFYRWGQDIIDWTYDTTDSLFHATNHQSVNTFGLEGNVAYRLNEWLRNVSIRYAYTRLSLDVATEKSNYLDHLRHKLVLNIDHGIYVWSKGCVGANWSLRWQDRVGTYVDIYGTAGHPYTPVLLLDGNIYMELAHVRVAAECTNITNRHYYDYGGTLMPGACGRIRITATW